MFLPRNFPNISFVITVLNYSYLFHIPDLGVEVSKKGVLKLIALELIARFIPDSGDCWKVNRKPSSYCYILLLFQTKTN